MEQPKIIQKVGDRGTDNYSVHEDYANCIAANPMSDRGQLVVEPQMLKTQRTEQAKELRKVNGDNGVKFADSQEYAIKDDGISKTVTTFAEKELLIAEPQPLVTKHPYQSFGKVKFTDVAPAILSTDFKPHLVKEPISCAMRGRNPDRPSDRTSGIPTEQRLEFGDDIANCLTSVQKDSMAAEPIKVRQATKQGYIECPAGGCFDANYPDSKLRRGRVQENGTVSPTLTAQGEPPWLNEGRVCAYKETPDGSIRGYSPNTADKRGISEEQYASPESVAATLTTAHAPKLIEREYHITGDGTIRSLRPGDGGKGVMGEHIQNPDNPSTTVTTAHVPQIYEPVQYYYRIRKLTPKECFRLMDVDDADIDKLITAKDAKGKPVLSKSASYKLSGNSIVVSCLFHIFEGLFYGDNTNPDPQLTLF